MNDKELKLNASGYKDEPCYKAIKAVDMPKPGEIYIHGDTGRHVLVLNHVNGVCAILNLTEQEREDRIPVMVRVKMYTNPIMITYAFTSALAQYVKTITDDEFAVIRNAVANALNVEHIYVGIEPISSGIHLRDHNEEVKKLTDKIKALEEKVKALEEERDASMNVADQIHADNIDASIQLEKEKAKSQFYREMYDTLLDKLISAKGGV